MRPQSPFLFVLTTGLVYALPFDVTPNGSLPTTYPSSASYTVTKHTVQSATGNMIKHLPPNVTIDSSGTTCAASLNTPFTLDNGQSCTLNLTIAGLVNRGDPDPNHHLMVCLSDGVTCAGPDPAHSLNTTQSSPNFVAAGYYLDSGGASYMALASSNNVGASWAQQTLSAPAGYQNGQLNGISCTSNLCVGAGQYDDLSSNEYAAFAVSSDQGNTWSQQILAAPAGYNSGEFSGVYCSGSHCVAAGAYTDNTTSSSLLAIATSADQGTTWAQQVLPLPEGMLSSYFNAVTCSGKTCIAAGAYYNDTFAFAGIAVSADQGATWSQQVLTLPDGTAAGLLYGVSCTSEACIAVGEYENSDYTEAFLGVAVSTDQGATWSQQTLSVPDAFKEGFFNGINCTASYCVAVGAYNTHNGSGADYYPLVGVTHDNGASWTQQQLTLPVGYVHGELNGVSCTGTTCVAAGSYTDNSDYLTPFIAVSTDSGNTWSQSTIALPSSYINGEFTGVG